MGVIERILDRLEHERRGDFERLAKLLLQWEKKPYPLDDFYRKITPYLDLESDLLQEYKVFLREEYPDEVGIALAAQASRDQEHDLACAKQSDSPLLRLPREVRDRIWAHTLQGDLVHVSRLQQGHSSKKRSRGRPVRPKYLFHRCVAPARLHSAATPPGQAGDHYACDTSGASNAPNINLVCKQMYLETLELWSTFYANNALQFPDVDQAADFLFHISENQRSSIRHLRIAIDLDSMSSYSRGGQIQEGKADSWHAICNYYSNPWDRRTLHMYPRKGDKLWLLKEPIYFYYSTCYYFSNQERMHRRWQVGRGNTSWCVGIPDLVYKGCPRLDLAMKVPLNKAEDDEMDSPWELEVDYEYGYPHGWLTPLLQFHKYDKFDMKLYDESGLTTSSTFEQWLKELKEHLAGPKIGPGMEVFFSTGPGQPHPQTYPLV